MPPPARRGAASLLALALVAGPAPSAVARPRALVVASDFETGQLSTIAVAAPRRRRTLPTEVFSDAVVRVSGGLTIVLDRFLADDVQVLGPKLRKRLRCGTGVGSNPHDAVVLDAGARGRAGKAYVTRYGGSALWVVDPAARGCKRFHTGSIELGEWADGDGLPEMDQMALVGTRLFVTLQRLDRQRGFLPTAYSSVAVIDTTTDTVIGDPIRLTGRNAFGDASGLAREPGGTRLAISTPGDIYTVGDGGIQWLDTDALTVDPAGFFVTEDELGGNVTDFVLVSATKAYAIVQARDLQNRLVAFDPSHAAGSVAVLFARDAFLPDIALAPDGTLWVADQSRPGYGVRILDTTTDTFVTSSPIDVGLPPFSLGFVP